MKSWRLVSGILSIIFSILTSFSACVSGALLDGSSFIFGTIVSILMLAGGIVSICVRKGFKGGNIALLIIFGLAAAFGFIFAPGIWLYTVWCLICAILAIIALVKNM